MSVENYTKLETYKGIKKRDNGLENIFAELKFNKKKPKYNYNSGMVAGMMVKTMTWLKPFLESKEKNENPIQNITEQIIELAKGLVNDYNWNMYDLNQLAYQFFGDES